MEVQLEEQVARLERETRVLKIVGLAVLVVLAVTFLSCLPATEPTQQAVVAHGLSIQDASGNTRIQITCADDGTPHLTMFDEGGRPRARLALHDDGAGFLSFSDESDSARIQVDEKLLGAPTPGVYFADLRGQFRLILGLHTDYTPALSMLDENGAIRLMMEVSRRIDPDTREFVGQPEPFLSFLDSAGRTVWDAR